MTTQRVCLCASNNLNEAQKTKSSYTNLHLNEPYYLNSSTL